MEVSQQTAIDHGLTREEFIVTLENNIYSELDFLN